MSLSLDEQNIYENCENHISRYIDNGDSSNPQLFIVDSFIVTSMLNAKFSTELKKLETLDSSILMRFLNARTIGTRAFAIIDYDKYLKLDVSIQSNSVVFVDGLFIPSPSAKDFVLMQIRKKKIDLKSLKRKKVPN